MNRKLIAIPVVLAGLAAAAAYSAGWFHRDTGLEGSGTVEARDIRVGSKIGGRIDKILVPSRMRALRHHLRLTMGFKLKRRCARVGYPNLDRA